MLLLKCGCCPVSSEAGHSGYCTMAGVSSFQITFSNLPCHQRNCHLSDDTDLLKHLSYGKSLRALYMSLEIFQKMSGLFSLEKKRLRGVNNISVYKYFMGENDDKGSRLFLVDHSDRTRGNEHKSTKFHLNRRKKPFTQ